MAAVVAVAAVVTVAVATLLEEEAIAVDIVVGEAPVTALINCARLDRADLGHLEMQVAIILFDIRKTKLC